MNLSDEVIRAAPLNPWRFKPLRRVVSGLTESLRDRLLFRRHLFSLFEAWTGIRHRAPLLGEHTDEVLGELGYAPSEIAALRAAHVV